MNELHYVFLRFLYVISLSIEVFYQIWHKFSKFKLSNTVLILFWYFLDIQCKTQNLDFVIFFVFETVKINKLLGQVCKLDEVVKYLSVVPSSKDLCVFLDLLSDRSETHPLSAYWYRLEKLSSSEQDEEKFHREILSKRAHFAMKIWKVLFHHNKSSRQSV